MYAFTLFYYESVYYWHKIKLQKINEEIIGRSRRDFSLNLMDAAYDKFWPNPPLTKYRMDIVAQQNRCDRTANEVLVFAASATKIAIGARSFRNKMDAVPNLHGAARILR